MLDYFLMDATIAVDTFFTIDETQMCVTMCIEDEDLIKSTDDKMSMLYSSKKVTTFPLGENLFNYLAISSDNLKKIAALSSSENTWNQQHENDDISRFFAQLDCAYLYLIFYSFNRHALAGEARSRLDRISKEFEFTLNFCCNDSFEPRFKSLTSLQRYYLYCQLYADNIYTIYRYYKQSGYLFMDTASKINGLDRLPRMNIKINDYRLHEDDVFEPVVDKAEITDPLISALEKSCINLSFRYQCIRIEECLMEELFSLIKLNIRVKKCKNCGKYFILKGDYGTEYCDRIPEGEKFTCKKLAAMKARKNKVQSNPILKEYEKAYKRMYARLSGHKISNEEFRLWVEDATRERDTITAKYNCSPSEEIVKKFKEYLGNK